jgi:hypothetical protein
MTANSLYLLVILGFAAKDQRLQPYSRSDSTHSSIRQNADVSKVVEASKAK